jgi:hypothetical protein
MHICNALLLLTLLCSTLRRGNERLFSAAKHVILKHYPEFNPERLPMHMAEWAQMIERDRAIARAAAGLT